ncbi:MAG: hypothetical protein ACI4R8_00880 [Candidatus Caccovivens sp.]
MSSDVLKAFAQKAKRRLIGKEKKIQTKIKVISNEDMDFKNRVEFLLSQEEVITNPVHYLIDDRILDSMNGIAKERYLLATLDKYASLRNELENQNLARVSH